MCSGSLRVKDEVNKVFFPSRSYFTLNYTDVSVRRIWIELGNHMLVRLGIYRLGHCHRSFRIGYLRGVVVIAKYYTLHN